MPLKRIYGPTNSLNITLNNLPNTTGFVGRQSDVISNVSDGWDEIHINVRIIPSLIGVGGNIVVKAILGDGNRRTDNARLTDADLDALNSPVLGTIITENIGLYTAQFVITNPPLQWGIHISNRTNGDLANNSNTINWFGASYAL